MFKKSHLLSAILVVAFLFTLNVGTASADIICRQIISTSQFGNLIYGTPGTATYSIHVYFQNGSSGIVNPSVYGLPEGVTYSFNPNSINSNKGYGYLKLTLKTKSSTPAGNYKFYINIGGVKSENTLNIKKRSVFVSANPQNKVHGSLDPELTYRTLTEPLVAGDYFSGKLARTPGENVGVYPILQGTLTAGNNYSITYLRANLIITSIPFPSPIPPLPTPKPNPNPNPTPLNNLILNPSLEISLNNGLPAYWHKGQWGTNNAFFRYPVEGVIRQSGNIGYRAAQVSITNYPDSDINVGGDAKWYFDLVSVTPGKTYTFTDQFKSDTKSRVVVEYHHSNGALSYQEIGSTPGTNNSWMTFGADFIVPGDVNLLTIYHLISSVGILTVDEYSLIPSLGGGDDMGNSNTFSKGLVTLTFDDGWLSTYSNGIPILNSAGYKSTQYIVTQANPVDGFMTQNQIVDLYNQGHDIAAHTKTHSNLTLLSPANLQDEVQGSRNELLQNFSPVNSLAYPYGQYNDNIKQSLKNAGFLGGRTVDFGYNDKTTDRYALKTGAITKGGVCDGVSVPTTSLEAVKSWIDTVVSNKTWLILTFHQIDDRPESCYGATPEMLQNIVNYLKASNVDVVTTSQALQEILNK